MPVHYVSRPRRHRVVTLALACASVIAAYWLTAPASAQIMIGIGGGGGGIGIGADTLMPGPSVNEPKRAPGPTKRKVRKARSENRERQAKDSGKDGGDSRARGPAVDETSFPQR